MRKRGRIDSNQNHIVRSLRAAGCSVQVLASVGHGCPDLLVGHPRSGNTLLEIKALLGMRHPKPAPLTPAELAWHRSWKGQVAIVSTPQEALAAVGLSGCLFQLP